MFNEFLLTTVLTSISIFLLFLIVCRNSGEKKATKSYSPKKYFDILSSTVKPSSTNS